MTFSPRMLEAALAGRKTVTRRLVGFTRDGISKPAPVTVGRVHAVQPGRGLEAVRQMLVRDVRREHVGLVDEAEARLEGFDDRADFVAYWTFLHKHWDPATPVWRIAFELVPEVWEGKC